MSLETFPISISAFAAHGITEETLRRFYHLRKHESESIPMDITKLNWRVIVGQGLGTVAVAANAGVECIPIVLHTYDDRKIDMEYALDYAVRTIRNKVVMNSHAIVEQRDQIRTLFEQYGKTQKQFDRHVIKIGDRPICLYQEVQYTKDPDDTADEYLPLLKENTIWLSKFLEAVYPKELAVAMMRQLYSLANTFGSTHNHIPAVSKLNIKVFEAGTKATVFIGEEKGYGFKVVFNGIDFISDEFLVDPRILSLLKDF